MEEEDCLSFFPLQTMIQLHAINNLVKSAVLRDDSDALQKWTLFHAGVFFLLWWLCCSVCTFAEHQRILHLPLWHIHNNLDFYSKEMLHVLSKRLHHFYNTSWTVPVSQGYQTINEGCNRAAFFDLSDRKHCSPREPRWKSCQLENPACSPHLKAPLLWGIKRVITPEPYEQRFHLTYHRC